MPKEKEIDVYCIEESILPKLFKKFSNSKDEIKFNFLKQNSIKPMIKSNKKIFIFEEKSYLESFELYDKLTSKYGKNPITIIISSNNEIFNVVKWMRKGVYDYLVKNDLTKDTFFNSIKSSLEYMNNKITTKKSEIKNDNYKPIEIPCNTKWDAMENNNYYDMSLIMIEIILNKNNSLHYTKSSIEFIYSYLKEEAKRKACIFGGRLWFWINNTGVLVFHFGDRISNSVLAAIDFYNNFFQICVEKLKLKEVLHFKIGIHDGNGIFNRISTQNITSDIINSLSHLTKKHIKENCLNITDQVFQNLSIRLKPYFKSIGTFENKKIYQYEFFDYQNKNYT